MGKIVKGDSTVLVEYLMDEASLALLDMVEVMIGLLSKLLYLATSLASYQGM